MPLSVLALNMAERWCELSEEENECTSYNFRLFAIFVTGTVHHLPADFLFFFGMWMWTGSRGLKNSRTWSCRHKPSLPSYVTVKCRDTVITRSQAVARIANRTAKIVGVTWPMPRPLSGKKLFAHLLGIAHTKLHTKFEVSSPSSSRDIAL